MRFRGYRPPRPPHRVAWRSAAVTALVLTAFLLFGVPSSQAQSGLISFGNGRSGNEVDVAVGQFMTVGTAAPVGRVVVGDPDIASVALMDDQSLSVMGNAQGTTNVALYDETGRLLGSFDVEVGVDTPDLQLAIRQAVPNARVQVQTVNGRIRLSGSVPDGVALRSVLEIAEQYGSDEIINSLTVSDAQQVKLEVRFIEASRNAGRELGVSLFASGAGSTSGRGLTTDGSLPSGNAPFGALLAQILDTGISADILVEALERKGLARRLAEPNLVALSGETASFLAGGEVPVPVSEEDGQVTVTYKEYGVRLNFTPVVLDDGLISLTLEPEVSQVDPTTTIRTGTIEIPAFTTRRAKTTIQLRDGQSFAIAGLLQTVHTKSQNQIPWLGQLPILGVLFRSSSFQKQETDLVIIVTPHLARPSEPGVALRTPLDSSRPSNDVEFFLLGVLEVDDSMLKGFANGEGVIGPYGHIIDLPPEAGYAFKKK